MEFEAHLEMKRYVRYQKRGNGKRGQWKRNQEPGVGRVLRKDPVINWKVSLCLSVCVCWAGRV